MTAQDYPITFPYGATTAPYTPASPHRGDDRPCPERTPIVIAGVTIGLTGSTGMADGPHLHIQEWQGTVANTRKPQNTFKPGVVTRTGTASQWGNFVTITRDGWNTTYAHLSQINVTVGQEILDMASRDEVAALYELATESSPTAEQFAYWTTRHVDELITALKPIAAQRWASLRSDIAARDKKITQLSSTDTYVPLNQPVYVKKVA